MASLISVVVLLWNGQKFSRYMVDASNIADLEVAPSQASRDDEQTPIAPTQPAKLDPPQSQSFVDPAIMSFSRTALRPSQPTLEPVSHVMIADGAVPSPLKSIRQEDSSKAEFGL